MIPTVGDLVHGIDVTGREVRGWVTAVHSVAVSAGPFSGGPVAVLDVYDTPATLVALVRFYDVKDCRRGEL